MEVTFDSAIGTPENDEADVPGLMIDEYETSHESRSFRPRKCLLANWSEAELKRSGNP